MALDACTLFDSKHSKRGLKCCNSIDQYNYCNQVYALCLDNIASQTIDVTANITSISLEQIEKEYTVLRDVRDSRPWPAYAVTLKPFLIGYMLDCVGVDKVFFVDSDVLFFSSPVTIETEMENTSVLVTSRHQDPPPVQGNINSGFFACDNSMQAREFVRWWQNRVVEWCLWEHALNGLYAEEGYLKVIEESPWVFPQCKITNHPGINMAWWNIKKHSITKEFNEYYIDNTYPLVNFHFQGGYIPRTNDKIITDIYQNYFNKLNIEG